MLIVEDQEDMASQLQQLAHEVLPHVEVDIALSQDEALARVRQASGDARYDVILLDYKLPLHRGERPVTNQEVYRAAREQSSESLIVHTTAYPKEPEIMERILAEARTSPLKRRSVFLSKLDTSWAREFIDIVSDVLAARAPHFHSCFISYSHDDEAFVTILCSRLRSAGINFWYATEQMRAGRKLAEEIEANIRLYDRFLLVLSEASMKSRWVEMEIRAALNEEKRTGRRKLCPIGIVPFAAIQLWKLLDADRGIDIAVELREYHIPDFTDWGETQKFESQVKVLFSALKR